MCIRWKAGPRPYPPLFSPPLLFSLASVCDISTHLCATISTPWNVSRVCGRRQVLFPFSPPLPSTLFSPLSSLLHRFAAVPRTAKQQFPHRAMFHAYAVEGKILSLFALFPLFHPLLSTPFSLASVCNISTHLCATIFTPSNVFMR